MLADQIFLDFETSVFTLLNYCINVFYFARFIHWISLLGFPYWRYI